MSEAFNHEPDPLRLQLLYFFCRMQLPDVPLEFDKCSEHLRRTYQIYSQSKQRKGEKADWESYLRDLYPLDWYIACGCLEGLESAWERLFATRLGRSDSLLIDSLRAQASRLYPRNPERQENAVAEFWTALFVPPEREGSLPYLARYDGVRPLAPWMVRVFHNLHVSHLRGERNMQYIPDDDFLPLPHPAPATDRWHSLFREAAKEWLDSLDDKERLLLGLRWRHQLSQREVAQVLGVHEGTISRRMDDLSRRWQESIMQRMTGQGWTGDDLSDFIRTELRDVLLDDPKLGADYLSHLLAAEGKRLPEPQGPEDSS